MEENGDPAGTTERFTDGLACGEGMREAAGTLSAAKAPEKDGKGNPYVEVISAHMPVLDAVQTAYRKVFRKIFRG